MVHLQQGRSRGGEGVDVANLAVHRDDPVQRLARARGVDRLASPAGHPAELAWRPAGQPAGGPARWQAGLPTRRPVACQLVDQKCCKRCLALCSMCLIRGWSQGSGGGPAWTCAQTPSPTLRELYAFAFGKRCRKGVQHVTFARFESNLSKVRILNR